jgi:hypothetical protein
VEERRESGGTMMGINDRQNEIVPPSKDSLCGKSLLPLSVSQKAIKQLK